MEHENEFLDYAGFLVIADKVKARLKTAEALPSVPKENDLVLYWGEGESGKAKGHVYQASGSGWTDITPVSVKQFHFSSASNKAFYVKLPRQTGAVRADILYSANGSSWSAYSCWAVNKNLADISGTKPEGLTAAEYSSSVCIKASGTAWKEMYINIVDESASLSEAIEASA